MKIDSKKVLKNLAGDDYTVENRPLTLGEVLAEAVATSETGGKMKIYSLAEKLYNATEPVDLDAADITFIKEAVEKCKAYNNLILGQALICLS